MNVTLSKNFPIPASADAAWLLLRDIEGVAGCMPGAKITERLDPEHFKGTVAVKFGPASMSFRGEIEVKQIDPQTRTIHLIGKGTDSTGSSGASMDLTARIEAIDDNSSSLVGDSEVSVSGKAAAFGGRMMNAVSDQVLKQFAQNFAARVQAMPAQQSADAASQPGAGGSAGSGQAAPAQETKQLDALGLIWGMIKDWFRSVFGASRK
ncbi:MAG: SRPBCC family protein [Quisquiliibacterium sp.]